MSTRFLTRNILTNDNKMQYHNIVVSSLAFTLTLRYKDIADQLNILVVNKVNIYYKDF